MKLHNEFRQCIHFKVIFTSICDFQWYMWSVRGSAEDVDNQHRHWSIYCWRLYLVPFNQWNYEEWLTLLGTNINEHLRVARFNTCLAEIL